MSDSRTPSLMPDAPRLLSHVRPFQTVKGPKCCQRNCHLADEALHNQTSRLGDNGKWMSRACSTVHDVAKCSQFFRGVRRTVLSTTITEP